MTALDIVIENNDQFKIVTLKKECGRAFVKEWIDKARLKNVKEYNLLRFIHIKQDGAYVPANTLVKSIVVPTPSTWGLVAA